MEIKFKTKKLERELSDPRKMVKSFGVLSKKINQRLKEINSAATLEDLRKIRSTNCHELGGKRKGEFALDISGNFRLIFNPDHIPTPRKNDGGIDWRLVERIEIISIEDYH